MMGLLLADAGFMPVILPTRRTLPASAANWKLPEDWGCIPSMLMLGP